MTKGRGVTAKGIFTTSKAWFCAEGNAILYFLICIGLAFLFAFCSNNDPAPVPLTPVTVRDLNAGYTPPVSGSDPALLPILPTKPGRFTFFSFKTGQLVARADSISTKWDIGFSSTFIILNGGTSGRGVAGVIIEKGAFDEIKSAPSTGYISDNKDGDGFAIAGTRFVEGVSTTANHWWFNSGTANSIIVTPIAGQVFIIRTADGQYAKMEILSYYKGAPAIVNRITDLDHHYTFRYVYQPGNSTDF
jgi:hypothetical protein